MEPRSNQISKVVMGVWKQIFKFLQLVFIRGFFVSILNFILVFGWFKQWRGKIYEFKDFLHIDLVIYAQIFYFVHNLKIVCWKSSLRVPKLI